MRLALRAILTASLLEIGWEAAPRTAFAGDGFARYLQQQAQARLRELARLRGRPTPAAKAAPMTSTSTRLVAGTSPRMARPATTARRPR
jgi:hypothetical protein